MVDVLLFSILHPVFASILVGVGLLIFLFMIFMMVSREPIPKDLERLKRDTERRAHVPGLGGGHGVLFLENGGPTPYQKEDEDY